MPLQVAVERVEGAEAARPVALPADDERPHPGLLGLGVGVVDAVVALQRVGHADHLPGVGGVGEHLLVAGHSGVEDHLPLAQRIGAEGLAYERPAVLQDQGGETLHSPPPTSRLCRITARSTPSISVSRTCTRSLLAVGTFLPT